MRGREIFMRSLLAHQANHIFGNPGTTENPLLESLADNPDINYTVALHEGVAVGAAGGYAQASGRTAIANVHVAPGLGNAIGMLYFCLKTRVPVIATAGQQDTRMRLREPLLRHDLVAMAAPVTKWAAEPQSADEIGPIMRRAFQIANEHPRGPVFLSLPNNVMEQTVSQAFREQDLRSATLHTDATANPTALQSVAEAIVESERICVLAGDDVVYFNATEALMALVDSIGATVYLDLIPATLPVPPNHPGYRGRLPQDAAQLHGLLAQFDLVLSVGGVTLEEIWYDAQPALPERTRFMQIETTPAMLARAHRIDTGIAGHLAQSLGTIHEQVRALADTEAAGFTAQAAARKAALEDQQRADREAAAERRDKLAGLTPMTPLEALLELAPWVPDNAVIVDEAITASPQLEAAFPALGPDQFYGGRGGGIGRGLAGVIGVATAAPERRTVVISGDGSAMYSIQALWSAAHHGLNILFVILANGEYRVLKHNLDAHRARFDAPSDRPYPNMDLADPTLTFVDLARGMGVPGMRATSAAEVRTAGQTAAETAGPYLIELAVQGKR